MDFYDSFDNLIEYEHIILGKISGVLLSKRGKDDHHVTITFIGEDDGHWFVSRHEIRFSNYWLADRMKVLKLAKQYMENNCVKTEWGWEFPEEQNEN